MPIANPSTVQEPALPGVLSRRDPLFAGSLWGPLAEVVAMLAAAAVGALIVHGVVDAAQFSARSPVAPGFGPLWAAVMVLLAFLGFVVQNRIANPMLARLLVGLIAGLAAGFVTAPLTAGLHGTGQPLNTIANGDMAFRTENVTRFAATWHLDDYTFRGLKAFYPPGWFWVAGRTAHYLGMHEPWHIVKPFTIVTIGTALAVAYLLWRSVLSPAGALAAAIGSSLVLSAQVGDPRFSTQSWYEPYSCFVAVTGAAWVAGTLASLRRPRSWWRLAIFALVGAALAFTYYLLFIILVVALIVLAALPRPERGRTLLRLAGVLGAIALLTAVFWVPLIRALLHGAASQGGFIRPDFMRVEVGVAGGPVALSLLSIVALVALVFTLRSVGSQTVTALIAATIVYQIISIFTLLVAHNQLQPHRAVTMMWATYGAALPVAIEGWRRGGLMFRATAPRLLAVVAAVVAIPSVFILGSAQGADLAGGVFAREAHKKVPELGGARQMSNFIQETTDKPPNRLTILSGNHFVLITRPYYGFLPLRARYAHPEAHLQQRISVVRSAAACPNAACTAHALETSKFGRIDAVILSRAPLGLRIRTEEDLFPKPRLIAIFFPRGSFDSPFWIKRDFPGYVVFVRRPGAPLP